MAGALKWINLYKISDDHNELESILDQSLTARYYDSDELYPDDLENVQMLDRPVYYYGDKKITEEELANSNLTANQMAVIWDWMVDNGNS